MAAHGDVGGLRRRPALVGGGGVAVNGETLVRLPGARDVASRLDVRDHVEFGGKPVEVRAAPLGREGLGGKPVEQRHDLLLRAGLEN